MTSAQRASSLLTVGSSPYQSSPTSASAMARRIRSEGLVTVSERRSIGRSRPSAGARGLPTRSTAGSPRRPRRSPRSAPSSAAGPAESGYLPVVPEAPPDRGPWRPLPRAYQDPRALLIVLHAPCVAENGG